MLDDITAESRMRVGQRFEPESSERHAALRHITLTADQVLSARFR